MARDDFSQQTRDVLAKRVGVRCSNPTCKKLTTGPRANPDLIVNIGVAAHITAASPGGPRYEPSLSAQQRQSADNGIWLCQNCAKLIDNDPQRYTVEVITNWKSRAEDDSRAELEGGPQLPPADLSAEVELSSKEVELSYKKVRITSDRHDYCLEVKISNRGIESISFLSLDLEMPAPVISNPEANPLYVPERSSRDVAFFRTLPDSQAGSIYPGDSKVVISVPYRMDHDLYEDFHIWRQYRHPDCQDLFDQLVKVTLYRVGCRPLTLERRFEDLQNF